MKKTSLLRNLIPALIVAVVLASSFVISAAAHPSSSHDKDNKCGYGHGQTDNDENDNNQKDEHGNSKTSASERSEKDCNEDENDEGGDHGDGGQGDQDHNDRQGDHDVSARPGEK